MIEDQVEVSDPDITSNAGMSLAERAKARRKALLDQHSVTIEVPGYEDMLAVEYRALSYAEIRKIVQRNQRQHDETLRELYNVADQLIVASINAYELSDNGAKAMGYGWSVSLAERLGVPITSETTTRRALFDCFPRDALLVQHYRDYDEWLSSAQIEIDEEQRKDFRLTS